jgi:hypothetical protein
MLDRTDRVLLIIMVISAAGLGVWAALFPASFYADFPGAARHWVALDGPYNEHLVRDVGDANLALAVVALGALLRPIRELVLAAAVAFVVAGVPHLVYHLRHADIYDTTDQIGSIGGIAVVTIVPLVLAIRVGRHMVKPEVHASVT